MKNFLLTLLIFCYACCYAQSPPPHGNSAESFTGPNIIPPSPTAYALGNYGNVPVGLFTGVPSVSVPLFTYKTNNINLPLSLFYGSNGIKLDEISSNVGLGWNLNFGGVISRTVRDLPDDTSQKIDIPANTFLPNNTPAYRNFIYNLGNAGAAIDTEADIYSFNFNGVSGKFFYDRNNQIHLVEQQALKIEKTGSAFIITLADGVKYEFNVSETTNFKTLGIGHQLPNIGTTAWYLTKITHPEGDEAYFTYEDMSLNYTASQSQNFTVALPYTTCQNTSVLTSTGSMGVVAQNLMTINGKRIKTITSNNPLDGTVTFTYSADTNNIDTAGNNKIQNITFSDKNGFIIESAAFNYLNLANKRNFLSGISFKDPKKSYAFDYENPLDLAERLSFSRDYWGYYNNKANSSLVPLVYDYNMNNYNYPAANQNPDADFAKKGMLKKITYPTKGWTELEYEGNTYWGQKTINPSPSYVSMSAQSSTPSINTQQYTFSVPITQQVQISGMSGFNTYCSEQTHPPIGRISISIGNFFSLPNGSAYNEGPSYQFTNGQTNTIYFNATAGVTYTITLSASRCSFIWADAKYFATAPQVFNTNLPTGGVRIKSTKDYDSPSAAPKYTRYYYGPMNDVDHSSGDKGTDPTFVYAYNSSENCSLDGGPLCNFISRPYLTVASNSLLPLFDTDKNTSTFYRYVTISHGGDNFERGGETKEFVISRDYMGSQLWGTNEIKNTPYTNYGWNNGLEVSSSILRKNTAGILEAVQSKDNIYEKNDTASFELKSFTRRRGNLTACQSNTPYYCNQYDNANPDHSCYGKGVGFIISMPYVDNIDASEYRTISYWQYLKSQKTTDYLNGIALNTVTEYFYNNPLHYQLSRQKVTSPDAVVNETAYSYAHEKGNQLMIGKNMTGIPLETAVTQTIGNVSKLVSKTETVYPAALITPQTGNLVLPLSIKSYDALDSSPSTEITYNKYDDKGNIMQYTSKEGTPVTILWGYNQSQPIAKIEGITYDQFLAAAASSPAVAASNDDASDPSKEGILLEALDSFRKLPALAGLQVSTYTYDPLIGVTSITPPSGIREVYVYDIYSRLKEVKLREKDSSGNYVYKTAKELKYNYKP